jgi:ATP/maltotriose-dependent transcriptional regulator MalT
MADDKAPFSIIRTKLHQPPIHENHIHRERLLDRLDQRLQRSITLVAAPAGYGKTTMVSCWLKANSSPSAWISLEKNDNDLRLFLNYFLTAVQTIFPDAGREIQAMVNALTLPPVSVLAGSLINELDRIEKRFILVLDDFHIIKDESVLDLVTRLLHHPPQAMHLVLIGRRDPSLPISTLRAKGLLTEIRTQDLRFNKMEIATFLTRELEMQIDSSTAAALEEKTEGWITGLRLAALSMRHRGSLDPKLLDPQVEAQYVMEYLFTEVFSHQPKGISQYLLATAILDRFSGPLCEAMCMPEAEPLTSEISGWDFIAWLNQENMFLIPLDAEKRWFRFHHLFQKLLLNQLERYTGPEDINALHARASAWFAENGLIEEALKHALTGGNPEAAARLVAQHGFNLVSEEQWPRLERWLEMIPNDIVYQDPELVVLVAWTHLVFSRNTEMISCLDRAEALFSDQPYPPAATKHLLGHLEAMRALQNYYSAEGERALNYAQRAIENIPLEHRYPRILVSGVRANAYQMLGDSEKTHSTIEGMIRDETLRGESPRDTFLHIPVLFIGLRPI